MSKFKDTQNREWIVTLADAPSILKIRAECDADFLKGEPVETFKRLENDPFLLCAVLYILCEKQMYDRKMTQQDFYLGVMGDAIEAASDALTTAIIDFFPQRKRELLQTVASKSRKINDLGIEAAMQRVSDPTLETRLMERLTTTLDDLFSTLPSSALNMPGSSA